MPETQLENGAKLGEITPYGVTHDKHKISVYRKGILFSDIAVSRPGRDAYDKAKGPSPDKEENVRGFSRRAALRRLARGRGWGEVSHKLQAPLTIPGETSGEPVKYGLKVDAGPLRNIPWPIRIVEFEEESEGMARDEHSRGERYIPAERTFADSLVVGVSDRRDRSKFKLGDIFKLKNWVTAKGALRKAAERLARTKGDPYGVKNSAAQ